MASADEAATCLPSLYFLTPSRHIVACVIDRQHVWSRIHLDCVGGTAGGAMTGDTAGSGTAGCDTTVDART